MEPQESQDLGDRAQLDPDDANSGSIITIESNIPARNLGTLEKFPEIDLPPTKASPFHEVDGFGRPKYKRVEPFRISRSKSLSYRKRMPINLDNSSLPDRLQNIYSPIEPSNQRYPTVLIHKKPDSDEFKLEAISPISDEQPAKPRDPSSSIIYPLKYNGSWKTPAVFDEVANLNDIEDESQSICSNQSSNIPLKRASQLTIPKIRRKPANYKNAVVLLLVLVVLLVCGFIPAVIILANGTDHSVRKYFAREGSGLLLKLLNHTNTSMATTQETTTHETRIVSKKTRHPHVFFPSKVTSALFYGVAYSPLNAMEPQCGMNKAEVMLDMQKLSQVTKRVRNYGMQCNQSDLILDSIQTLGLDMKLAMGVWIGHNDTSNKLQLEAMKNVLTRYPRSLFETIFVGNEVLFREDKSTNELVRIIDETKYFLKLINYNIPVGTSEIGSLINKKLLRHCDIIGANIHPFFGGDPVEKAVDWMQNFLKYQLEPVVKDVQIIVTEVGWPSGGGSFHKSVASVANFKQFVSMFLCKSKHFNFGWYFFEAFDEPWKKVFYEGDNKWETQWGIFNSDRSNKIQWSELSPCVS